MTQSNGEYYIPWDVAEARALDEARSYAAPTYDLSKLEDRQRCWFVHLVESYGGGPGLFYQTYDLDRNEAEDWMFRGKPRPDSLARHQEEFDSLAANDPRWAQLNVMGAKAK